MKGPFQIITSICDTCHCGFLHGFNYYLKLDTLNKIWYKKKIHLKVKMYSLLLSSQKKTEEGKKGHEPRGRQNNDTDPH